MRAPRTPRPRPGTPGRVLTWLPDGRPADVYSAPCPSRQVLDRIADKWTALIIGCLSTGTKRYSELGAAIEGISEKMLTQTLRSLERDGIILRSVHPTVPPRVEYQLTPLGSTLTEPLAAIRDWAERHINDVNAARIHHDRNVHADSAGAESRRAAFDADPELQPAPHSGLSGPGGSVPGTNTAAPGLP